MWGAFFFSFETMLIVMYVPTTTVPRHATLADVHDIELRMAKIKADLLSELVGVRYACLCRPSCHLFISFQVSITRSEFDAAELVSPPFPSISYLIHNVEFRTSIC